MTIRAGSFLLLLFLFVVSCSSTEPVTQNTYLTSELPENVTQTENTEIASLLEEHREKLDAEVGVKIAELTAPAEFGKPEGSLGNIAADAIRFRASREARKFVNLGFIGGDSFFLNFDEGKLTLGEILEFMPYENHLVIVKITGDDVLELSKQIAARGGEPVSGLRFRLEDDKPRGVLVNSETVQRDKYYWLATSNFYANGGGGFSSITNPVERMDFEEVSIRQLYVDHFKERRVIEPQTDGRIR